MRRKVIKQKDSYTITLPMKWVKAHGADKTREIDLEETKEGLIIQPERAPSQKKQVNLEITFANEPFIRTSLNNIVRLGYDKITVTFQTPKQKNLIEKVTENFLLGFEITDSQQNKLVIESVAVPDETQQETILRRIFLIIKQTQEQINQDFREKRFNNLQIVQKNTQKINHHDNFCRRNTSKKRFLEEKTNFYWGLNVYLLLVQHSLLHLYEILDAEKKFKVSDKINKLFSNLQKGFDDIYQGFYKKDFSKIQENNILMQNTLKTIQKELKKSKGTESLVLYYLGEQARLIYLTTAPMLGIIV